MSGKRSPAWRSKLRSLANLSSLARKFQKNGWKIVFTNGCFDILHLGHVDYLERAKRLGDILVVAVNRDASVRRLKGPTRPVNCARDRAGVLSGLACVDYVVLFGEETPRKTIQSIKPDILVKGGDWTPSKIVGADFVKARGGKVYSLPFLKNRSTTGTLKKIKNL